MAKAQYRWRLHQGLTHIGVLQKKWLGIWWTINRSCDLNQAKEYARRGVCHEPFTYFEVDY